MAFEDIGNFCDAIDYIRYGVAEFWRGYLSTQNPYLL